jgi:hypothetical protein
MVYITDYVGGDPARFGELVKVFIAGPYRVTQRAAWPLSYCVENHPGLVDGYWNELLHALKVPRHNAVTRNVLRLLQFVDVPEEQAGEVMHFCFELLAKPKEAVANQAFALTILANLAPRYPEIKSEILLSIENRMPHASPGFRSRAKRVIEQLGGQL